MCKHPKGHKFQKFDESSLFCERCGERRVIAPQTWTPDWTYRPWPYITTPWQPSWYPPYRIWSGNSTDVAIDGITVWSDTGGGGSIQTNAIAGPQTQTPRGVKST